MSFLRFDAKTDDVTVLLPIERDLRDAEIGG